MEAGLLGLISVLICLIACAPAAPALPTAIATAMRVSQAASTATEVPTATTVPTETATATLTKTPTEMLTNIATLTSISTNKPSNTPSLTRRPPTATRIPPSATSTPYPNATVVPVCGSNTAFVFGDEVPLAQRNLIRDVLKRGASSICAMTDIAAQNVTVFVYGDYDKLTTVYAQWIHVPLSRAHSDWPPGKGGGITYSGVLFYYADNTGTDPNNLYYQLSHEYFHLIQYQLTNGKLTSTPDLVPVGGPRWLIEGSADFVGALTVENLGGDKFDTIEQQYKNTATTSRNSLSSLEDMSLFADQAGYQLGFMAVDYLTPPDQPRSAGVKLLAAFWSAIGRGKTWRQAFQSVFGKSVDQFYAEFEAYRSRGFSRQE